jgi:TP901 family phage tail tape measure protein
VFERVNGVLDQFTGTADRAAEAGSAAGKAIDDGLLQTASGADALELANARVAASTSKLAAALQEQAAAEQELLAAQSAVAGADDADAGAADRLVAANTRLMASQRDAAGAAKELSAAQGLQSDTAEASAAKTDEAAAAATGAGAAGSDAEAGLSGMAKTAGIVALGMAAVGYESVKAAGNFQDATTHLVTDAGESAKNLAMVQAGILNVATSTGQSATDITNAMYHIESAGYHGAAGLTMLKVAAEGARVGGADLDTVSKTLVGAMNAYGMSSKNATSFMNQLITTVGQGDMRMQDLAGSLSAVTPLAAALHIQFAQVGGAIATMTAQGMSADQASQDLANSIRALSNPSQVAVDEMNQMGINAQTVQKNLGKEGLTGTLSELTDAITKHMGPAGQVILNAFNQSTTAGNDMNIMLSKMPASLQKLAKGYEDGTVTSMQWRQEMYNVTPVQKNMMTQFGNLYDKVHQFNSLLASGGPAEQTYTAALSKMMGGATGLNTALMLTGGRMPTFQANVKKIADAAKGAGSNVDNWSRIQGTFNFKMQSAKTAVENTGIAVGTALLPAVTALLQGITSIVEPIAEWTAKHKTLTEIIFAGVAAIAATVAIVGLATKAYNAIKGTVETVGKVVRRVAELFQTSAEEETAASQEAAVAQEEGAAKSAAAQIMSAVRSAAANIASAASSAAAWLAANAVMTAGILLVVVAVAAAVYEIVRHWHTIVDAVEDVWNAVYGFISKVIGDVISFVKAHWQLLIGIITGPLGIIVAEIVTHWRTVEQWFQDGVNAVEGILSWFGQLPGMFLRWLGDAASAVVSGGERILSWFESLPDTILHYVAGFGSLLLNAGEQVVMGLIHGIEDAAGGLLGTVSRLAGDVSHAFASVLHILSPSKVFEGHGQNIVLGLAQGITGASGTAVAAAQAMAQKVLSAATGLATQAKTAGTALATATGTAAANAPAAGAGGTVIYLDVRGNTVMGNKDIDALVDKIGKRLATVTLPSAGRATKAF